MLSLSTLHNKPLKLFRRLFYNSSLRFYNNTNTTTNGEFPYVYEFTDDSTYAGKKNGSDVAYTKGSTVVFDMQYLWNAPQVDYAIYYFEVPVNAGEFAMGSHSGKDKGTYFLYLDLSANAGKDPSYNTENKIANDPVFTQIEYTSSGYVINACFNIAYVIPANSTKETFSITVNRSGNVFSVVVVNNSNNDFNISVLLVDNNNDPDDDYPYTYTLKYNTGQVSSAYDYSARFRGVSGGNALNLVTT